MITDKPLMKVSEVIEKLTKLVTKNPETKDYTISLEGCDCYGDMTEIDVDKAGKQVYFNR